MLDIFKLGRKEKEKGQVAKKLKRKENGKKNWKRNELVWRKKKWQIVVLESVINGVSYEQRKVVNEVVKCKEIEKWMFL